MHPNSSDARCDARDRFAGASVTHAVAVLSLIVFICCSSATSVTRHESWSAPVISAVCRFYGGGFGARAIVVDTTQPIVDFAALLSAEHRPVTPDTAQRALQADARARQTFVAQKISFGGAADCGVEVLPKPDRYIDAVVIEISGPMLNPYDGSTGTFVRSSAGGRPGGEWLWVRLARARGEWRAEKVLALPVNDG